MIIPKQPEVLLPFMYLGMPKAKKEENSIKMNIQKQNLFLERMIDIITSKQTDPGLSISNS